MNKQKLIDPKLKQEIFDFVTECRIGRQLKWSQIEAEFKSIFYLKEGKERSFDNIRQKWALWYSTKNEKIDESKELERIAAQRNAILKERRINVIQKKEIVEGTKTSAFREILLQTIEDNLRGKKAVIPAIKLDKNVKLEVPIYVISDEHYRGKKDNHMVERLFYNIKKDITENKYKKIKICFLGDCIDGLIHTSGLLTNDGAVIPSVEYAQLIGDYIEDLSKIVKIEVNFVIEANHSQLRSLNTNRSELAKEDLGYVMDGILRVMFRDNPNIEYNSGATLEIEHYDKSIYLLHGHQKFAGSRVKLIEHFEKTRKYTPDMIIMGHYHSFKVTECGINKYLVVAPCCKNWENEYDNDHGYGSNPKILKILWEKNGFPTIIPLKSI